MYSVVLATVLTTGTVAPGTGFGWFSGCHGCHGCWGCYGCCGGCYGCWGCCGGCNGCWGCYGCCGGCYGCNGCYGCYGCNGCWGCCGGTVVYTYPVYSCNGCYGGAAPAVVPVAPEKPKEKLPAPTKSQAPVNSATVVIAAPADVHITVNGQAITLRGTEQAFVTPELEPDANYSYMVKAETVRSGQSISETRKVSFKAGAQMRVDFGELAATPAVAGSLATR